MSKEIRNCKFGELDEVIRLTTSELDISYYEVRDLEDGAVADVYGIRIIVPGLKLSVREGYIRIYSFSRREEEDDWDWGPSVTLIYDETEEDPEEYSYVGDDEPREVVINKYLQSEGMTIEDLNNLDCIVEIELDT